MSACAFTLNILDHSILFFLLAKKVKMKKNRDLNKRVVKLKVTPTHLRSGSFMCQKNVACPMEYCRHAQFLMAIRDLY